MSLLATAVPSAVGCSTETRPPDISLTKTSPLDATSILRGPVSPAANMSTLKPCGAASVAMAGRATSCDSLLAEGVAKGAGSASTLMRWTRPGASFRQSADRLLAGGTVTAGTSGCGPDSVAGNVCKYAIRSARSAAIGTATGMAVPGTSPAGDLRNGSSVAASQVRFAARSALV